jgi:ABC-2 type transport system permease protein
VSACIAAARLQLALLRGSPGELQVLATTPLYALIFLTLTDTVARPALVSYAIFAPVLIALWSMALFTAGDVVVRDKQLGVLEAIVASPARLGVIIAGRVATVTMASLLAFVEVWAVALAFRVRISVHHPVVLLAAVAATVFAAAGTALLFAAFMVTSRGGRIYQNSLSYPLYLVSGILVPLSLLPDWVHPVSWLSFLTWSAGLLRGAFTVGPVPQLTQSLVALFALGTAAALGSSALLRIALRRLRVLGTLGYS